jgi:FlaA1/EpsC-like NDP-sugar epimerase
MKRVAIYGAKSVALGVYKAVTLLYPDYKVDCFLVSSLENNPTSLAGVPVRAVGEYATSVEDKEDVHILIGTPENVQGEIAETLKRHGFCNYTCIDSNKEAALMERYYAEMGRFPSLHSLEMGDVG